MLIRGRTSRLPGHKEARFLRGRVITPVIAQQPCHSTCLGLGHSSRAGGGNAPGSPHRAPVVCLVTVPVWCLDTAAVQGGGYPPRTPPSSTPPRAGSQRPPHRAPVVCLVTVPVWCLDTAAVPGGGKLPPGPPPSRTPPRAGSQTLPVWCLDTAALPGGVNPPPDPTPRARPLVLGPRDPPIEHRLFA